MIYDKNIIETLHNTVTESLRICNDTQKYTEKDKLTLIMYLFSKYSEEYSQFLKTLTNLQNTFSNYYHVDVDVNNQEFVIVKEMRSVYQYRYNIIDSIDSTINKINSNPDNNEKLPTIRQITNILTNGYKENSKFPSYCLFTKDVKSGGFIQVPVYEEYLSKWKTIQNKQKGSVIILISWLKRYTSLINKKYQLSSAESILKEIKSNPYKVRNTDVNISDITSQWQKLISGKKYV